MNQKRKTIEHYQNELVEIITKQKEGIITTDEAKSQCLVLQKKIKELISCEEVDMENLVVSDFAIALS